MPGLPRIYVNFSTRDPEGRFYVARLSRFSDPVRLSQPFIGTDFDQFEVECVVLAIDYVHGRVYHRPVRPSEVPGTYEAPQEAVSLLSQFPNDAMSGDEVHAELLSV